MKLLTAEQIRQWDRYTIENEPIRSIDLMERASRRWTQEFTQVVSPSHPIYVFAGQGNNGGDGLAIARMLIHAGYTVKVYQLWLRDKCSPDNEINRKRLLRLTENAYSKIEAEEDIPEVPANAVIIDALWGTGLNKPLEGLATQLIERLNSYDSLKVSVDIPSGLPCEGQLLGPAFKADWTITFQVPKLSFLFPETGRFVGEFTIVDIGLLPEFLEQVETRYFYVTQQEARNMLLLRERFAHKGTLGHALIIGGSIDKAGAVIMATIGALSSGCGLVTAHLPQSALSAFHGVVPSAMASIAGPSVVELPVNNPEKYNACGMGPGMGTDFPVRQFVKSFLEQWRKPLVLDADALNIIAMEGWQGLIPDGSILTPHPGEWRRLTGNTGTSFDDLKHIAEFTMTQNVIVVLKGAYTVIATPDGEFYFNSSGNELLATGGSGDILTGLIAGLLARGYEQEHAAILGVYLHGLAADIARQFHSVESFTADQLAQYIDQARKILYQ